MKKILLAFDEHTLSDSTIAFIRHIHTKSPLSLTAAVLPAAALYTPWQLIAENSGVDENQAGASADELSNALDKLVKFCEQYNIRYTIRNSVAGTALHELKAESLFADLLIISSGRFYPKHLNTKPGRFLTDALREVYCPVLLLPDQFHFPETNILAYDGSRNAIFAIKQFAYLFPELMGNESSVLFLPVGATEQIPSKNQLKELMEVHYRHISWHQLTAPSAQFVTDWIRHQPSPLLVAGAFGRTELSLFIHQSFVADIMGTHQVPVFIAHV